MEPRLVYRFVDASEDPAPRREWFLSDREAKLRPWSREKEWPELRGARSFFASDVAAKLEWQTVYDRAQEKGQPMQLPESIAEVRLEPDQGFEIDDLHEPDEHLLIRADAATFVPGVLRVYPAKEE